MIYSNLFDLTFIFSDDHSNLKGSKMENWGVQFSMSTQKSNLKSQDWVSVKLTRIGKTPQAPREYWFQPNFGWKINHKAQRCNLLTCLWHLEYALWLAEEDMHTCPNEPKNPFSRLPSQKPHQNLLLLQFFNSLILFLFFYFPQIASHTLEQAQSRERRTAFEVFCLHRRSS